MTNSEKYNKQSKIKKNLIRKSTGIFGELVDCDPYSNISHIYADNIRYIVVLGTSPCSKFKKVSYIQYIGSKYEPVIYKIKLGYAEFSEFNDYHCDFGFHNEWYGERFTKFEKFHKFVLRSLKSLLLT